MIEREKKILLTRVEYETLFELLLPQGCLITQRNHYYDTPTFLATTHRITYRIREKDGKYQATVKEHCVKGSTECSLETNVGYAKNEYDVSVFETPSLVYQGVLETQRLCVNFGAGVEVALDKNLYLGHCDYELEVEYAEDCEKAALECIGNLEEILKCHTCAHLFKRINLGASKSERFFFRKRRY